MNISAETLDKVSEIVRTELSKRLPASIRVHLVKSEVWTGYDDDFIHVTVVYEGERKNLNPRTLNEFDEDIEPLLIEVGIYPVPSISYANLREVNALAKVQTTTD
jgi:hypothetical protein